MCSFARRSSIRLLPVSVPEFQVAIAIGIGIEKGGIDLIDSDSDLDCDSEGAFEPLRVSGKPL